MYSADSNKRANCILDELVELLDIPQSYYDKAVDRYRSMSDHFHRPESTISHLDPSVYPQGSFRLGTVIRPLVQDEGYDLDLVCRIAASKALNSQKDVKELLGVEVKSYSKKQNFKLPPEEGKRCWTQQYQDEVDFHMDVLPSIPEEGAILARIQQAGVDRHIAQEALAITDRTLPNYPHIDTQWPQSNPKGYAIWFDERMDIGGAARTTRKEIFNTNRNIYATIDDVPSHRLKTPLQRAVQLLKRHRDQMFRNEADGKPISIIITTLAARAYGGETDLAAALGNILENMGSYVSESKPRIANPVDPREDFADRWTHQREANFWRWLRQAREDFASLGKSMGHSDIERRVQRVFSISIPASAKATIAAMSVGSPAIIKAKDRPVTEIKESAAPSWGSRR